MLFRALADLILVLHFAFIVFAALGGLLALRFRWAPLLHLPAVLWGFAIELTGAICPLTPAENALRRTAGEEGYSGGFIEHYLLSFIYPAALSRELQLGLAAALLAINLAVYLAVWRRLRRRR